MLWNKTKCAVCHSNLSCSEKTKFFINYCGSQRVRNQPMYVKALDDCLSRRGLNYIRITTQWKTEELEPVLTS
jgi:hypothetical protein